MLLTVRQVAERLNCSESFVRRLIASGRLKHHVLGAVHGGKRISELQLAEYLRATERGGMEKRRSTPTKRAKPDLALKHLSLD
jgi:excisionase family DNA binding protein